MERINQRPSMYTGIAYLFLTNIFVTLHVAYNDTYNLHTSYNSHLLSIKFTNVLLFACNLHPSYLKFINVFFFSSNGSHVSVIVHKLYFTEFKIYDDFL